MVNADYPRCLPGCLNLEAPYCHCRSCGETGLKLDDEGLCSECHRLNFEDVDGWEEAVHSSAEGLGVEVDGG